VWFFVVSWQQVGLVSDCGVIFESISRGMKSFWKSKIAQVNIAENIGELYRYVR